MEREDERQPSRILSLAKLTAKGHVLSATAPTGGAGRVASAGVPARSVAECQTMPLAGSTLPKSGVTRSCRVQSAHAEPTEHDCALITDTCSRRRASNRGLPVLWTNMESEERPVQAHALQELRVEQAQQRPETCRLRPHAAGCWRLGKSFELLAQVIKHFEFFVCWLPADRLLRAVLGHHRRG